MRRAWMPMLAGLVMGMLVMAALPTLAANGDAIYLGEKNTALRITKVRIRNGIMFEATAANTPAATFKVASGAPIAVDSTTTVEHLSADYLDGRHSYQLWVNWDGHSNDNIPDAANWSTDIVVLVPTGGGAVVMNGGVGWYNNTGGPFTGACRFKVDGSNIPGSFRADYTQNGEAASCSTEAFRQLSAGFHTITFTTFGMATAGVQLNEGAWYVLVLPN